MPGRDGTGPMGRGCGTGRGMGRGRGRLQGANQFPGRGLGLGVKAGFNRDAVSGDNNIAAENETLRREIELLKERLKEEE
jgi:hypothetical protein